MNPGRSDLAAAINVLAAQGWFSQRSEETRARLSAIAKLRNFAKDELVYLAGDPPNGVFGLVAGSLNVRFRGATARTTRFTALVPDFGSAILPSSPAASASSLFALQNHR